MEEVLTQKRRVIVLRDFDLIKVSLILVAVSLVLTCLGTVIELFSALAVLTEPLEPAQPKEIAQEIMFGFVRSVGMALFIWIPVCIFKVFLKLFKGIRIEVEEV